MNPTDKLDLAAKHLGRVQDSWTEPDWADLAIYGLYCLEAAVEACALALGITVAKHHWDKARVATDLHEQHGLPDVESLMRDLNDARKAEAYGDIVPPNMNAEEVAAEIEQYVAEVTPFVRRWEEEEGL